MSSHPGVWGAAISRGRRLQSGETHITADPDFGFGVAIGFGAVIGLSVLVVGAYFVSRRLGCCCCHCCCPRQAQAAARAPPQRAPSKAGVQAAAASRSHYASGRPVPKVVEAAMTMQASLAAGKGWSGSNPLRGKQRRLSKGKDAPPFAMRSGRPSPKRTLTRNPMGAAPPGVVRNPREAPLATAANPAEAGAAAKPRELVIGSQRVLASALAMGTSMDSASSDNSDGGAAAPAERGKLRAELPPVGKWKSNPGADAGLATGQAGAARARTEWASGTGLTRLSRAPTNVKRILRPPVIDDHPPDD